MINYNTEPFWDNFDPNKNYHRILFQPGRAVQARELTQSQTILQNQISQFASAIYSQNTPVSGGKITTNLKCHYIKLNTTYAGSSVSATKYLNQTLTDSTGTINARVIAAAEATGTAVTIGDPPTLVVTYLSGQQFSDGMTIYIQNPASVSPVATSIGVPGGTTSVGNSSVASISAGVFYVVNGYNSVLSTTGATQYSIGNFVNVLPQTVILDKYDNTPSLRVGLVITEKTVTSNDDSSLLDPAAGASNYQAPGADRYQITLTLETRPLTLGNDDTFIELLKTTTGQIQNQTDNTVYSAIDDYFAKRTYDTNGDFVVTDFSITPTANVASPGQYDIRIGKGVAYVHGYRLENQSDLVLTNDRARTTASQNTNSVYVDYGSYFYVDTVNGVFDTTIGAPVDLHIVPVSNIVSTNTTTYSSTLVGKGYIRNLNYDHNTSDANTISYVYKAYVYDITANTLTGTAASGTGTTISFADTTGKFSATANAYLGVNLTIDSGIGTGYSGTIVSYNGSTKTATVSPTFSITPTTSSNFSLRFGTQNVRTLANTASGTTTVVATAGINLEGKVGGLSTGATIYENPNYPELIYPLGYSYVSQVSNASYESTQVFRNLGFAGSSGAISYTITLPSAIQTSVDFVGGTGTISSDSVKQNYIVINTSTGNIVDFSSSGNTVYISPDKNSVTFTANVASPFTAYVIAKVNITDASSTVALKTKTLVTANTTLVSYSGPDGIISSNTYVDLTNAQVYIRNAALKGAGQNQYLYVTDVKRIVKIVDTGAPGTVPTLAMLTGSTNDVTANYSFNNGQHDTYYGHAFLSLNPGAPKPKGNILVLFDFYKHSSTGDGYFSYESYRNSGESYGSMPTYTSKNGTNYNLRDCVDFRPCRKNGTASYVLEVSADPAATGYTGTYIPQDLTQFASDYSWYLGRKDRLVLSKDKSFQIAKGNPAVNPILPVQPDGSLIIANLSHDPYTTFVPSETPKGVLPNLSVEKVQHRRWTMSDISDLQTQVNNIEYYTSLNVLEQNANALQVPDSNGLNRFKNGILVDDFSSYGTADTANPDFNVSIDRVSKQMSATQTVTNYPLQSAYVVESLGNIDINTEASLGFHINNIGKTTNYFSLPYTTTPIITQQLASNTVNLNPFTTPVYQGTCYLNPPMDNWVDNTKAPDLLLVDPNLQIYQQSNTLNVLNVTNWQTIPGTQYTTNAGTTYTIGHNINPSPYGYVGYSTTTNNTFASQQSQTTLGYWSNLGSSYNQSNGFITDVSIQPYIRPQQLIFRSKNMKTNTPVSTFFDGVNVDKYIINPDIVELTSVSGTFNEDDVIGYYDTVRNVFFPVATVVAVYVYPNSTNVRLYITSNFHTSLTNFSTGIVSNAFFDTAGNYISSTASGTSSKANIVSFNNSGYVSSVGGSFTDASSNTVTLYRQMNPAYCAWLNQHGVWKDNNQSASFASSYTVNFPVTGYYTFTGSIDNYGTFSLDGGTVLSAPGFQTTYTASVYVSAGNHTVGWSATNTGGPASVGLTVTAPDTSIIFDSAAPVQVLPAGTTQVYGVSGGGGFWTGVTQVALNPSASTTTGLYVGSKLSVTSTYILQNPNGTVNQSTQTYYATITAYDGPSRIATLDTPISVTMGYNMLAGGIITSTYSISGTQYSYLNAITSGGVPSLSTNENGNFVGIFNIPKSTFQTGSRIFRVDNRTTPGDPGSATTWTEATFTASGLSTTSQAIDFSPSITAAKNTFTRTQYRDNVLVNTSTVLNPWDPVAQTFIIDKANYPNGAFLSSAKFFFQSKPTTSGAPVELSIVGTLNGYPNGTTLDNSIVQLTPDQVKTSSAPHYLDPATYTEFTFPAPVYIQPNVLYSFILHSSSTEYNVYTAAQNATAIPSSVKNQPTDPTPAAITKIGTAPYVGSLFESQNSITWTADQTKALMFVVNRAKFNTAAAPNIQFILPKGLPNRKLSTQDIANYYSSDMVSGQQGTFTTQDIPSDAINLSTTDFVPTNTSVNYNYESLLKNAAIFDGQKTVVPGKFGSPTYDNIYYADSKGERLLQANNTATFSMFASLSSTDDTVSPIISDDGTSLYNVQWNINNLGLANNVIAITSGGTGYNAQTISVTASSPSLGGAQAYLSANVANGVIQNIYVTSPGSGYLAPPTITISDPSTRSGNTDATVSVVSEYSPAGGNAVARYVTKKNTLSTTNDSQDLRVYLTAYRPAGTNIYVFYRIQNRNDNQTFENGAWQLMTYVNNSGGFSTNRGNTIEFEAAPGINGVANNQLTYTSTTGTTYTSFNQFAIKVVLTTADNTTVPYLSDIRVLALPSGTGL